MNQDRLRRLYGRHQRARGDGRHCPAPEALHALARGELPEAERLAAFDHVMACRSCGEEFELLRAIERAGKAEAAGAAPPASDDARVVRLSSRRARRWLAPLALAA
ncbi:MAG TPA: hypothetical protein VNK43_03025, partial [Gemmatimonadales bacterium]|nr:hypothetical protein [Gemmatimonadales bacterium]